MDYKATAQGILKHIGGADNVVSAAHCATRLRLVIADNSKMDKAAVEDVDGVKGAFEASGQIQIIIGTGAVNKVYDEFIKLSGASEGTKDDVKAAAAQKQNWFMRAIKTLGDIFVPIIPAIVASGLLNGLLGGLTQINPTLANSGWYNIINMMAGAALTMLPILIAISAAKKFGGNQFLAAVIGFVMIHPSLVSAWSQYVQHGGKMIANPQIHALLKIGSFTVKNVGYQGHVIPVIIAIWFMCTLEKRLHKVVPEMIDLFVTPLVTVLVTGLLTFIVIGPVFSTVESWILLGATTLIKLPLGIGGLIIGFVYAFTVVAGFHHMYNMIEAQMLGSISHLNIWMPVATAANVGQGAAAMAVAFKTKNKKTEAMAFPASLSAFLGITEPAIFGVNVRYRRPFISGCIGGAVGGMLASWMGIGATAYGVTGLFGFLIVPGFWVQYGIMMAATFAVAFAVSFITYKDPAPAVAGTAKAMEAEILEAEGDVEEEGKTKVVYAPAKGKAILSSEVQDPTFAAEVLGPGMAIIPEEGKIYAPFDGTLSMMFDTKHALGLVSDDGVEVLIHVGVDTVNLKGEHFTAKAESGDRISRGQLLLEFDIPAIEKAGYHIDTPVIVTNGDQFKSVKAVKQGPVEPGEPVIEIES
jgi:PTS system sucrose-specific IIC component